ncbi:hypothetical protein CRG98_035264 [Punica granatum]|uniref:Uncharacterized protein n=1 Tax=Punica granatum TaxID=22663 RepID=A0A2I0IKT1_PUNGR|nr:hypothetical protein CRG98_035264 [Punica granatum]
MQQFQSANKSAESSNRQQFRLKQVKERLKPHLSKPKQSSSNPEKKASRQQTEAEQLRSSSSVPQQLQLRSSSTTPAPAPQQFRRSAAAPLPHSTAAPAPAPQKKNEKKGLNTQGRIAIGEATAEEGRQEGLPIGEVSENLGQKRRVFFVRSEKRKEWGEENPIRPDLLNGPTRHGPILRASAKFVRKVFTEREVESPVISSKRSCLMEGGGREKETSRSGSSAPRLAR